jgi:hypothetical protein
MPGAREIVEAEGRKLDAVAEGAGRSAGESPPVPPEGAKVEIF